MASILFLYSPKNKKTECRFENNGMLVVTSPFQLGRRSSREILFDDTTDFLEKFFKSGFSEEAPEGKFFRFTNDRKEFQKIKSGKYTKSLNHVSGELEEGISVSEDLSYIAQGIYKYFYIVSGSVIGIGSDGEPLLDAKSMQIYGGYKSVKDFEAESKKIQEIKISKFMKEHSWSKEDFQKVRFFQLHKDCPLLFRGKDGEIKEFNYWKSCEQMEE